MHIQASDMVDPSNRAKAVRLSSLAASEKTAVVSGFRPEDSWIISNYENQAYSQQVKIKNKRHIYQSAF